ncbi:hypothetical protein ABGB17_34295 [Sphaerisporangium sp. B11E5]|uniref:hypothetical protein n=1 Tax=Sphaerisporangium sp. B11E5 TaxID=3153563 RepID=UPI00325D8FB3
MAVRPPARAVPAGSKPAPSSETVARTSVAVTSTRDVTPPGSAWRSAFLIASRRIRYSSSLRRG